MSTLMQLLSDKLLQSQTSYYDFICSSFRWLEVGPAWISRLILNNLSTFQMEQFLLQLWFIKCLKLTLFLHLEQTQIIRYLSKYQFLPQHVQTILQEVNLCLNHQL